MTRSLSLRALGALGLSLGLAGCPDPAPPPPPPAPPAASGAGDQPEAGDPDPGREPSPASGAGAPGPALPEGPRLEREQLLAYAPADAFAPGIAGQGPRGMRRELQGTAATAMVEQLKRDGTPTQALDLVLVSWHRATEAQGDRSVLVEAAMARLRKDLELQVEGQPSLARWTSALVERVDTPLELSAGQVFLEQVRRIWHLANPIQAPKQR